MTCVVAVMNTRGIALAADSAVTLGDEKPKIYNTAEKLFSISSNIPVAFMTFGSADLMDAPWETIIGAYAQRLGNRRFDTLEQYAGSFFSFIEGWGALFPQNRQEEYVGRLVGTIWSGYRAKLEEEMSDNGTHSESERSKSLRRILDEDIEDFEDDDRLDNISPDYGSEVLRTYADVLKSVEAEVFDGIRLNANIRSGLLETAKCILERQCGGPFGSGIVIAGMGEEEPFPATIEYFVGTLAAGRLRYRKSSEGRINGDCIASVMPFAQRETIDMIISGIHPHIRAMMLRTFSEHIFETADASGGADDVEEKILDFINDQYEDPFMTAVSALPRQDLAKMAEALVNLTAFIMRMSADQDETVSEPIDVAILSKSDGFTWVKHKDLVREGRVVF